MSVPPMWRTTASIPGTGGQLEPQPEDFVVDEVLPFSPDGAGGHLFIQVRKAGATTHHAVAQLLKNTPWIKGSQIDRDIGIAGLKDRWSIATQWISVPGSAEEVLPKLLESEEIQVLKSTPHGRKLKRGQVRANHFRIRIRNADDEAEPRARAIIERLKQHGFANLFGPQRFGRYGDNVQAGLAQLRRNGRRISRRLRNLLLSSVQAEVFNRAVTLRAGEGKFSTALVGDWMKKHETGGMFQVDDPAAEQPRVDALEISPTSRMPGKKGRLEQTIADDFTRLALAALEIEEDETPGLGPGTLRPIRLPLPDLALTFEDPNTFVVEFSLPSGAFASMVLDEIIKPAGARFNRAHLTAPAQGTVD